MANDLEKLADVTFTAGIPAQPYRPAREVTYVAGNYTVSYAGTYLLYTDPATGQPATQLVLTPIITWVDLSYTVTIPAVPYRPYIPPTISANALTGWNSSAISLASLADDGGWRFTVPTSSAGVIVGLANENDYTTPNAIEHGAYVSFTSVQVWEAGQVVVSGFTNDGEPITVLRNNGVVTLSGSDWSYTSSTASTGAKVLDASLYAAGDMVIDPQPVAYIALGGSYPEPALRLSDSAGYADMVAAYPEPLLSAGGLIGTGGTITLEYPAPDARFSDDLAFAGIDATYPAPTLAMDGGLPYISLATILSPVPLPGIALDGFAGRVGSLAATVPEPVMRMADAGGYADIALAMPAPSLIMVSRAENPWATCYAGLHAFAATMYSSGAQRTGLTAGAMVFSSAATVSVQTQGTTLVAGAFTMASTSTLINTGGAVLVAGAVTHDAVVSTATSDATTLCTNMATGAVTRFTGMDFAGYARTSADVIGWDDTGVYAVGDYAGTADVSVNFGVTDLGTNQSKSVPMVLVAAATDVPPQIGLTTTSGQIMYNTFSVGTMWRASTGKGIVVRNWDVQLIAAGASDFSLEAVEIQYAPLWRKGMGR